MANFVRLLMRRRGLVAAAWIASLVLALFSARTIKVRFQVSDFYDYEGNPATPLYRQDSEEFGDPAGYVVAMIDAEDVFAPAVLEYVQRLTAELSREPVFARVLTLNNTNAIRAQGDSIVTGPLIPTIPSDPSQLAEIKQYALSSALFVRRLVSRDARTTAVLAQMRTPAALARIEQQAEALAAMQRAVATVLVPKDVRVRVTGAPRVEVDTTYALMSDQLLLVPTVIAFLIVMLFLTFRSWHGVVLAQAAVGTATIWTAGIFALFDRPVDIIGSVIPTTILVYGVVDPIFVLTRVLQKLELGRERDAAITEALGELALPCFLTSLTTALGFAAFVTAVVPTMRYFGITVACGVMLSWVTTNTILPLLLSLGSPPKRMSTTSWLAAWIDRSLVSLWSVLRGRTLLLGGLTLLFLGAGAFFARKQNLSSAYVEQLPSDEAKRDVRDLEQRLGGVVRMIVFLEGPSDSFKRPDVLKAIERVDHVMERERAVTLAISIADVLADANRAFNDGDPAHAKVPQSGTLVSQYLSLVDPVDRSMLVSDDFARSHIALLIRDHGSKATAQLTARLEQVVREAGFEALGVRTRLTGNGVVVYPEMDRTVIEILHGFVVAFAIIVLLQWLLFRSLRLALISMVPNLVPVVTCFCITRLLHIDLRIDTALVLCVSIGGLFNTTIHYSACVLRQLAQGARVPEEILLHAMRTVGPPSLYTTAVLSVGFAVFTLSSFAGLRAFGWLSMVTFICGFFADMIVTTALMRVLFDWKSRIDVKPAGAAEHYPSAAI